MLGAGPGTTRVLWSMTTSTTRHTRDGRAAKPFYKRALPEPLPYPRCTSAVSLPRPCCGTTQCAGAKPYQRAATVPKSVQHSFTCIGAPDAHSTTRCPPVTRHACFSLLHSTAYSCSVVIGDMCCDTVGVPRPAVPLEVVVGPISNEPRRNLLQRPVAMCHGKQELLLTVVLPHAPVHGESWESGDKRVKNPLVRGDRVQCSDQPSSCRGTPHRDCTKSDSWCATTKGVLLASSGATEPSTMRSESSTSKRRYCVSRHACNLSVAGLPSTSAQLIQKRTPHASEVG